MKVIAKPEETPRSHNLRVAFAGSAVILLLLLAYSNHWHNSFHFDDAHTIEHNGYVQSLSNLPKFFTSVKTFSELPTNRSYRPIVTTSLAVDYALSQKFTGNGLNTLWYHISTFVVFLLQGLLLFYFFREIIRRTFAQLKDASAAGLGDWLAFIAVAIYMLHPSNAETINYIIARSDLQSTVFVVLGFVTYQWLPSARKYFLYLIPIILGCLAKPTAIMFAPMLLVYQILFEEETSILNRKWMRWNFIGRAFVPVVVVLAACFLFMRRMEAADWQPGGYSLYHYVITQPYVIFRYVLNFLVPIHFSADTDLKPFDSPIEARALLGYISLVLMIWAVIRTSASARWRPVSFGLAWFLLALVPTSIVPLAEVTNDHRVFYPYVGLSLAVVWTAYLILQPFLKRVPVRAAIALCLAVLGTWYSFLAFERNEVWRNDETLWRDVTIQSPENGRGMMNYGLIFMARGSYDTAYHYFAKGLELAPNYGLLYTNLGVLEAGIGHADSSMFFFQRAIALDPRNPAIYEFYGNALAYLGKTNEAIASYQQSLKLAEANVPVRHSLMDLLYHQGRAPELREVASRTLQIMPADSVAIHFVSMDDRTAPAAAMQATASRTPESFLELSLRYYQTGDFQRCIDAADSALALRPNYPEAYINICAANNSLGRFGEGRKAGERAVQLAPNNPLAKGNLAWSVRGLATGGAIH